MTVQSGLGAVLFFCDKVASDIGKESLFKGSAKRFHSARSPNPILKLIL